MPFDQLALLTLEAVVVVCLILALFHKRASWGVSPLFIAIGVFQYMQVILASFVYVDVTPFGPVSPGSVVLFTSTLFAILLVYIYEDILETRKLICGLALANVVAVWMSYAASLHLASPAALPAPVLPPQFFSENLRVLAVGTVVLVLDAILIVVVYEALSPSRFPALVRIYVTVTSALFADHVLFATGAFVGTAQYVDRLVSGVLGKATFGAFFATVLWLYLRLIASAPRPEHSYGAGRALKILSYRQRFERLDKEFTSLRARETEKVAELNAIRRKLASEARGRIETEFRLRDREERLSVLSRELLQTQETEKRALAQELHDEVGQLLTTLRLEIFAGRKGGDDGREALNRADAAVDSTLEQIRSLSLRLRPTVLDDHGLAAALERSARSTVVKKGIDIEIEDGLGGERLPSLIETVFYRVGQESFTNVARHSRASRVSIALSRDATGAKMVISDDGDGFDLVDVRRRVSHGQSLGLLGMVDRVELAGGELMIDAAPGRGTRIEAVCPLPSEAVH